MVICAFRTDSLDPLCGAVNNFHSSHKFLGLSFKLPLYLF